MEKLTFTLKQHTPIIHFQHDQAGATLRASEVKPRLDRFILEKLGGEIYEAGVKDAKEKGWLIKGAEYQALDYMIKIFPYLSEPFIDDPQFPFFGNIDTDNNLKSKKKSVFFEENLKLCFSSFHKHLFDSKFILLVEEFFLVNNFGSRATKGYGSFSVVQIEKNNKQIELTKFVNSYFQYSFDIRLKYFPSFNDLFNKIHLFWKIIRSGYNQKGLYIKPLIFLYSKEKNWQWDKKSIKQYFFNGINKYFKEYIKDINSPVGYSSESRIKKNFPLLRATLGLAQSQKWDNNFLITKDPEEPIERFSSPIVFKPIRNADSITVYFDWIETNTGLWGRTFLTNYQGSNNNDLQLTVPRRDDFDPDGFMKFLVNKNPRDFFNFKFDGAFIISKINTPKTNLENEDRLLLANLFKPEKDLVNFDFSVFKNEIGKENFSIYDKIQDASLNNVTFKDKSKVKTFIDSFNPDELSVYDLIFNQLNENNNRQ